MTAGTGDATAAVEVKPKCHAETVHMDEPAAKIDSANGDLSGPPRRNEHAQPPNGTTHAENGVIQSVAEATATPTPTPVTELTAADQSAPLASPIGRLSYEDGSGVPAAAPTPPLPAAVSASDPAAPPATAASPAPSLAASSAAVSSAAPAVNQPSPAASPAAVTASHPAPAASPVMTASHLAPAAITSPPSLVSTPPALVSTPAAAPVQPPPAYSVSVAASSPAGRKRSAEAVPSATEPATRQPRHSSSERQPDTHPRRSSSERQPDAPVPHRTVEMIESSLHKLKREVKAIDLLARQKEREWDNLLRLRRAKEETFQRLRRKREVLLQQPAIEAAMAAVIVQAPAAPAAPTTPATPAPRPAISAASTHAVSSAIWALKQQHEQQRQQQQHLAQHHHQQQQQEQQRLQQRLAQHQAAPQYTPRASAGLSRPLRPVPVPSFVGAAVSSASRLPQPARSAASESHEPQYRDILAQVARLNQRVTGQADQAAADAAASASAAAAAAHHSNLAKLLMEKKKQQIEPALLEMLKPQMAVRPSTNGPLLRTMAPAPAAPRAPPPPPPPPPAAASDVPVCQGCGRRQAQFVCAGCGHQWYCSRDCQVEAWDSHADECSG